jgi:hypothetical protein
MIPADIMNALDDHTLKTEIEEIAKRIDHIIKTVNQLHPEQPQEATVHSPEQTMTGINSLEQYPS